jgi:3-oxoacyl-[acyl-carrier protein] reductase
MMTDPWTPEDPTMETRRFLGRRVLVTGASGGIGRACAVAFAHAGARVAVHYHRGEEAARATLRALEGAGHILVRADLGDDEACRRLVAETERGLGGLDVLVNNAGLYLSRRFTDHDEESWREEFRRQLRINLEAPALLSFLAARGMIARGFGRIVNVGSRGAYRGEPEAPGYGAAKAGLHALTQSLAQALAPYGVAVTAVAPGWVETAMASDHLSGPRGEAIRGQSPLGRVGRPEEIARAVLFLADEDSEYLTGAVLDANGASYLR